MATKSGFLRKSEEQNSLGPIGRLASKIKELIVEHPVQVTALFFLVFDLLPQLKHGFHQGMLIDIAAYAFAFFSPYALALSSIGISACLFVMTISEFPVNGHYATLFPVAVALMGERKKLAFVLSAGYLAWMFSTFTFPSAEGYQRSGPWLMLFFFVWVFLSMVNRVKETSKLQTENSLQRQRLNIAYSLHDNLAHTLSMLAMRVQSAKIKDSPIQENYEAILQDCDTAISQLRGMLTTLRDDQTEPTLVMALNLTQIYEEIEQCLTEAGFSYALKKLDSGIELSTTTLMLCQIFCREALNNVTKHGNPAKQVEISFGLSSASECVVIDFVNAINTKEYQLSNTVPLGIVGLQEQLTQAGGEITYQQTEKSWKLSAALPLSQIQ